MTTLGKILVIINLIFSLVTGALVVMVYATRTNWHAEYVKRVDELKASQATTQSLRKELEDEKTSHGADVKKLQDSLAAKTGEVNSVKEEVTQRTVEVGAAQKQSLAQQATSVTAAEEAGKLRNEVVKLTGDIANRDKRMLVYEQEVKELRDKAVSAEIAYKSERDRIQQMLEQLAAMSKENERLRTTSRGSSSGGGAGGVLTSSLKPPPEDVQGTVTESDPKSGFVTINVGSDKGVAKGHTLEVFRTTPTAKYLGKIMILDARPHEAVGRPVSQRAGVIQKGDTVAVSILPPR